MLSSEINLDQRAGTLRVDRAIFELRRGRPVEVQDAHGTSVYASIERLDPDDLKDFASPEGEVRLVIMLMTNNPDKLAALSACGIEVVGRMPLSAPVNAHNASYLRAKRDHAGHLVSGAEER